MNTISKQSTSKVIALVVLLGLLSACGTPATTTNPPPPNTNLTKFAQVMLDESRAVGVLQTSVLALNQQMQLSDADTRAILVICQKVNTFTGQASAIIRGQASLPPAQQSSLLALLLPITTTLSADITNSVINIKNVTVRNNIQVSLLGIQTLLVTLQAALS